jgi:DinB family protein
MDDLDNLRYPIGRFERLKAPLDRAARAAQIDAIEQAPDTFRRLVAGLSEQQLETPYRPGGWTIRQVIHHVPDSHMNAYVRMKLAVTEDAPAVRAYDESRWAELPEAKSAPVTLSIELLAALHRRWVAFLRALPEQEFRKEFQHPEWGRVALDEAIAMYAWHGRHHAAHVRQALSAQAAGVA